MIALSNTTSQFPSILKFLGTIQKKRRHQQLSVEDIWALRKVKGSHTRWVTVVVLKMWAARMSGGLQLAVIIYQQSDILIARFANQSSIDFTLVLILLMPDCPFA